jgi:hypothetical protein
MVFGFNLRNEDQRLTRRNLARDIAEFEWILAGAPPDQPAAYEARIERYKQYPLNVLQEEYNRLFPLVKRNVKYLAKQIAQLEWVAAGAPPDQRAAYEERIQRYEQYPLNVLEREHNRLNEGDDADIAEALGDLVGEAVGEGVLPINGQVRAINDEQRARARAFFGEWKNDITLTTAAAPHIGTKDVPKGSENFVSRDDIEDGDEMVELHGNPAHIYKKSSINQWISKRKEQFPRNPIKNPYTGEYINQENIKRYTAKLKTKPKNKDKNKNNARKSGGSKKRKSLRVRHRTRKSQ